MTADRTIHRYPIRTLRRCRGVAERAAVLLCPCIRPSAVARAWAFRRHHDERGYRVQDLALIALLSFAVAATSQQEPPKPFPIEAASWVKPDDYPGEALRAGEQGSVHVKLTVNEAGMPTNCAVATSSGSAVLDGTTCRILLERSRFRAAVDAAGKPVSSVYEGRFRWALPDGGQGQGGFRPIANSRIMTIVEVKADGSLISCKTSWLASEALEKGTPTKPESCPHLAKVKWSATAAGKPAKIIMEEEMKVVGLPPLPESHRSEGEFLARQIVRFKIDAEGRAVDCEIIDNHPYTPLIDQCDGKGLPWRLFSESTKLEAPITLEITRSSKVIRERTGE